MEALPQPNNPNIGLLNEGALHASLKQWYAEPGDAFEVRVGRFVADIVRRNRLIEIQTGNLAAIKSKLNSLTKTHEVRLVYPIARERWIVKHPKDGNTKVSRRRSPKQGREVDLFGEMVSFPELLMSPNFSLEILMIREEQIRRYEGQARWRTRGWVTEERRLLEVLERMVYEEPRDWRQLLPQGLTKFTARELGEAMYISARLAQQIAYCLRRTAIVDVIGKRGRANLYGVTDTQEVRPCGDREETVVI